MTRNIWIYIILLFLSYEPPLCAAQEEDSLLGTFVVTAYNIANEADWPCQDTDKILAKGLDSYYCPGFLKDILLQGSGVDNSGSSIQIDWSMGSPSTAANTYFRYVPYIETASGNELEDGVSIAVDTSVIPFNTWVYIEEVGFRRADDTGGNINGNRIDVFMNVPNEEARNFGKKQLKVWIRQPPQHTGIYV